jgi:flavin-dependent dehydrogenase
VGGEKAAGAYAIEAKLPRGKATHYPGMQFDFQAAKGGYGWLFPKGDHINVGLYVSRVSGDLPGRDALKAYAMKTLGSDDLDAIQGYPLGTRMGKMLPVAGRVLFAGDALGATEPLLGEGIYGAILTGQLAAAALLEHPQDIANAYRRSLADWHREVVWLNRIARLFYRTTPLAYGGLHHLLRDALTRGYAAGLTPLQSTRLLRGAKLDEF